MEPFATLTDHAVPFSNANIDTDQILPARYLHRSREDDQGQYLFRDLRLAADGSEIEGFPLNHAIWRSARILLGGENFACGSSRENAVWALADRGVRAVIAPSFGDIFAANAMKNGMLAVVLPAESVASLMAEAEASTGAAITIDLPAQTVTSAAGTWSFEMNPFSKRSLLEGLDDLAFTLTQAEEIAAFERRLGRSDS